MSRERRTSFAWRMRLSIAPRATGGIAWRPSGDGPAAMRIRAKRRIPACVSGPTRNGKVSAAQRKTDREGGAAAGTFTRHRDRPAVQFDEMAHDREAEPESAVPA